MAYEEEIKDVDSDEEELEPVDAPLPASPVFDHMFRAGD